MTHPQHPPEVPLERWRVWLGRILLIPMISASGGFIFILIRVLMTGQMTTVSKGWQSSSSTYTFSQNPVAFVVLFAFYAALALGLVWVTMLVARRAIKGTRPA